MSVSWPTRAKLVLVPAAVLTGAALWIGPAPAPAETASLCDRTVQVRDAIVAAAGASSCSEVAARQLRDITSLDLSGQQIAVLRDGDFDGLARLDSLDLSGNLLASLPEGIFDDLYLLRTLRLNGNVLTTLPSGIFDSLSFLEVLALEDNRFSSLTGEKFSAFFRFYGTSASGDSPDNSGSYPRIQRFLDTNSVTTVEGFIAALPALHKERFVMVYESGAPAEAHVSGEHPRIIAWGSDGRFTFAWNTDPDAPPAFRETVEFLRQDDQKWTAGVIDFAGTSPAITEPESCQTCHGSLNKPLWGIYARWKGTEFNSGGSGYAESLATMRALRASTEPRIASLDFSRSSFDNGETMRLLSTPGAYPYVTAPSEAGGVWSWRHAEVLLRILKAERGDLREYSEAIMCETDDETARMKATIREFDQAEHNLFWPADTVMTTSNGHILSVEGMSGVSDLVSRSFFYTSYASVSDAMVLLMMVDLWQEEPAVRHLYRETTSKETAHRGPDGKGARLFFPDSSHTAEEELIQKYRAHFGQGGRAALKARAKQVEPTGLTVGLTGAGFWKAHIELMRPRVCRALAESAPQDLAAAQQDGAVVLTWTAPTYDADSLTGTRIFRAAGADGASEHLADAGASETTWTDDSPPVGDLVYTAKGIYDGYYLSPDSNEAETTVAGGVAPTVGEPLSFTVLEGDTAVATLTATDPDTPVADLVWSVSGGADRERFALTPGGELTFAAAKDFEAPDDADGDGTYAVTVNVNDGANDSPADLSVTLTDRNERPTADAGPDQTDVPAGSSVTLGGTGEDPDASDVLSYSWTQTGGATVTLSDASSATASFTAPADLTVPATLEFVLRVTDRQNLFAEDEVSVGVIASGDPLTAWVEDAPSGHDGSTDFLFGLRFSEEIAVSYATLRDSAFVVTGGTVEGARRQAPPSNQAWRITVAPNHEGEVVITLPGGRECGATGAICTAGGKRLSHDRELRVPWDDSTPLTAQAREVPERHDGVTPFTFELWFSENFPISYVTLRDDVFEVTGGTITRASRVLPPSNTLWLITVQPTSDADVSLTLPANRACESAGAVCTPGGRQLSNQVRVTVPGPPG